MVPFPSTLQPLIERLPSDGHDIIDVSAPAEEKSFSL